MSETLTESKMNFTDFSLHVKLETYLGIVKAC